jgi:adenylate kinase family enzyme
MEKNLYIIIGRSGCGKGTQAALIKNEFEEKFNQDMKHITTGGNFRDFIEKDMYTAKHSKEIIDAGGLMPEFLSIWGWTVGFRSKGMGFCIKVLYTKIS